MSGARALTSQVGQLTVDESRDLIKQKEKTDTMLFWINFIYYGISIFDYLNTGINIYSSYQLLPSLKKYMDIFYGGTFLFSVVYAACSWLYWRYDTNRDKKRTLKSGNKVQATLVTISSALMMSALISRLLADYGGISAAASAAPACFSAYLFAITVSNLCSSFYAFGRASQEPRWSVKKADYKTRGILRLITSGLTLGISVTGFLVVMMGKEEFAVLGTAIGGIGAIVSTVGTGMVIKKRLKELAARTALHEVEDQILIPKAEKGHTEVSPLATLNAHKVVIADNVYKATSPVRASEFEGEAEILISTVTPNGHDAHSPRVPVRPRGRVREKNYNSYAEANFSLVHGPKHPIDERLGKNLLTRFGMFLRNFTHVERSHHVMNDIGKVEEQRNVKEVPTDLVAQHIDRIVEEGERMSLRDSVRTAYSTVI